MLVFDATLYNIGRDVNKIPSSESLYFLHHLHITTVSGISKLNSRLIFTKKNISRCASQNEKVGFH